MTNTTTTTKTTNKFALTYILENCELPVDVAEKVQGMLAQLEKRSSAERKPSARQIENEKLKDEIILSMDADRKYSVAEMIKEFSFFPADITPQRVSALMTQLVEAKKVEREVVKRKVLFFLPSED